MIPILSAASAPGGHQSVPRGIVQRYQPLRHPRKTCHHLAQRHPAGQENLWRMTLRHLTTHPKLGPSQDHPRHPKGTALKSSVGLNICKVDGTVL